MRLHSASAAVISICLVLAGCSPSLGLRSFAPTSSSVPASSSTSAPATVPEIHMLFAYAACELLGRNQLDNIAPGVYGTPGIDPAYDADTCTYTTDGATWVVRIISKSLKEGRSGADQGTARRIDPIEGYPSALVEFPGEVDRCNIAVVVTNSQNYLLITVDGAVPGTMFPNPCDGARRIAAAAIVTFGAKNRFFFRTKASAARPPQPRIDLHGVDPCTLLDSDLLRTLGGPTVNRKGRPSEEALFRAPSCSWSSTGASLGVNTVSDSGLIGYDHTPEKYARDEGFMPSRLMEVPPIRGYPTFLSRMPRSTETECHLVVDVADGQLLRATFMVSDSFRNRFAEPCEAANRMVDAALTRLTS